MKRYHVIQNPEQVVFPKCYAFLDCSWREVVPKSVAGVARENFGFGRVSKSVPAPMAGWQQCGCRLLEGCGERSNTIVMDYILQCNKVLYKTEKDRAHTVI